MTKFEEILSESYLNWGHRKQMAGNGRKWPQPNEATIGYHRIAVQVGGPKGRTEVSNNNGVRFVRTHVRWGERNLGTIFLAGRESLRGTSSPLVLKSPVEERVQTSSRNRIISHQNASSARNYTRRPRQAGEDAHSSAPGNLCIQSSSVPRYRLA